MGTIRWNLSYTYASTINVKMKINTTRKSSKEKQPLSFLEKKMIQMEETLSKYPLPAKLTSGKR